MTHLDLTRPVRKGEELDARALGAYLRGQIPGLDDDPQVEQFPSGHSNLTYLIRAGDREWVLRRPPFGAKGIRAGHDMGREYRILSRLTAVYPPAPKPVLFCQDEAVMGAPFYVMERKKGVILRKDPPAGLALNARTMKRLSESLVDNLVAIHGIDYRAVGLGDLGRPEGFLARQVQGWAERYEKARTDEIPEVGPVVKWCLEHVPDSPAPALIHNDYKFDNVVLDPDDLTKIIGVLDWEMSTVGDPLLDLGVMLSYWIRKDDPAELQMIRTLPTHLDGVLTRQEVVERYARASGRDVSRVVFYFAFALFKLTVIAQQIYSRYARGFTRDERFALMLPGAVILARHAWKAIDSDSIRF
jgi:aminoglycoside phosphotransferase (APT) family kinase protein